MNSVHAYRILKIIHLHMMDDDVIDNCARARLDVCSY